MITSVSNPRVKALKSLQKSRERRQQGLFQVEGLKEIHKALVAGYQLHSVYFCPDIIDEDTVNRLLSDSLQPPRPEAINKKVYSHLAYRERTEGVITCFHTRLNTLANLKLSPNPLLLVVESVEKPGNLGALLRTADAAGIDAVMVCDERTDLFNPNVIRSSLGCIFTVPTITCSSEEAIHWLKNQGIRVFGAALSASRPYYDIDYKGPTALVMGTEATGLSELWLESSDQNIIIPMHGVADSMNVSTSAAVLIFEAIRQRSSERV